MKLKITVHGVAYEVDVEVLDQGPELPPTYNYGSVPAYVPPIPGEGYTGSPIPPPPVPAASAPQRAAASAGGASVLVSPVAGTVLEVKCKKGDKVSTGQVLLVIEAMKMHTSIASDVSGVVKQVLVSADDAVREGQTLVEFE